MRVISFMVVIYCLASIIFSTWVYLRKFIIALKETKRTIKIAYDEFEEKHGKFVIWLRTILKNKLTNTNYLKDLLSKALLINSTSKASGILFVLSFAIAVSVYQIGLPTNNFVRMANIFLGIILLLGIANFFSFRFSSDFFVDLSIYLTKLGVFLIFSLIFMQESFKEINNIKLLFICLGITVFFSVYLLKSIIDGFRSTIFFIANFLLIYIYNLAIIGLCFGYYYLTKNEIYKLFENPQIYLDSFDTVTVLSIIFMGLKYFFTIPSSSFTKDIDHLIPFLQYIFGYVVNIGIIGFFISYIASKVYSNKKESNIGDG